MAKYVYLEGVVLIKSLKYITCFGTRFGFDNSDGDSWTLAIDSRKVGGVWKRHKHYSATVSLG